MHLCKLFVGVERFERRRFVADILFGVEDANFSLDNQEKFIVLSTVFERR